MLFHPHSRLSVGQTPSRNSCLQDLAWQLGKTLPLEYVLIFDRIDLLFLLQNYLGLFLCSCFLKNFYMICNTFTKKKFFLKNTFLWTI